MTDSWLWVIIIYWPPGQDDGGAWVYGPYEHQPTAADQAAARASFCQETETSDNDWDEYGVHMDWQRLFLPKLTD